MTKKVANPTKIPSLVFIMSVCRYVPCTNIPNEDIPLLFDHYEVSARILMFSHERMGDKVEKNVRKKATGLWSW
jgi:hypothetical protein